MTQRGKNRVQPDWPQTTVQYNTEFALWKPIPVAEPSKVRVCSRSFAEIAGSNPAVYMDACLL